VQLAEHRCGRCLDHRVAVLWAVLDQLHQRLVGGDAQVVGARVGSENLIII
jgi:hypothetical protein